MNTTNLSYSTASTFVIKSSYTIPIWNKVISLKVIDWNVLNWVVWNANNSWQTCKDGYSVTQDSSSNNIWKLSYSSAISESTSQKASVVNQSVVGAAAGATVVFSMCNLSTPQGVWITMNQFQLILLLLLTNSHIPQSIVDYLSGLKATTWSLNFVPFKDIPGVKTAIDWLDFGLDNNDLKHFGLLSGSTFVNNFSLVWVILMIIVISIIYIQIFRWVKSKVNRVKICKKVFEWIYQLFTFSIYIRLLWEANQFILLSSLSEIKSWKGSSTKNIVSLWIAFICAFSCIGLIVLAFVNWIQKRNIETTESYSPFKEFFSGLKDKSFPRLYLTILLLRRLIFVVLLVMGSSIESLGLIIPMIWLQAGYLCSMAFVRPYKSTKNNLLEIVNEVYYFILITILSHFNSTSRWIQTVETAYLYIIIGNSLTIISIMISNP